MSDVIDGYGLALSHAVLGNATVRRLLKRFGTARQVWEASEKALSDLLKDPAREKFRLARKRLEPERLVETYQKAGVQVVFQSAAHYPALLNQIHDPPFVLYIRGNLEACRTPALAIVGTRNATDYGLEVIQRLLPELQPYSPSIISGLAAGIDAAAHQAALTYELPTVAVLGTGIDRIYPQQNQALAQRILQSGGAIVSEYPIGMSGDKYTFPRRNRIIAGLSEGTLVVEGSARSGSLITARYALEENRQVMAVPGSIFKPGSEGPHALLHEGAAPVHSARDVIETLNWSNPSEQLALNLSSTPDNTATLPSSPLSAEEQKVFGAIVFEPTSFDEICARHQELSVMDLQTALTMLELQGLISALPGTKFCRN